MTNWMDLGEILKGFNAPLNEEQAWAICHQHAKRFIAERNPENYAKGYSKATALNSVRITKEGEISIAGDEVTTSEKELVMAFGRVLFDALEYGTDPNEEKLLSPDLERLIERTTLAYDGMLQEEDDEGYEEDQHYSIDHGPCTWEIVVKMCEEHLDRSVQANEHYLAVCRALITEAVDLKSFLEKVAAAGEKLKTFANINNNNDISDGPQGEEFPKLNFTEWAHLWIQVVSDLRVGVKLKKVEGYTRNVEFELTPYEILMEDIRRKKYSLKKVLLNGEIPPRVKKNAHDIILDFIKSRPTLKPIGNRKLRPAPPRSKSLHERLLEQIQEPPSPLRHVGSPKQSPTFSNMDTTEQEGFFKYPALSASKSCEFTRATTPSPIPSTRLNNRRRIKAPPLTDFGNSTLSTPSDAETVTDEDDSSFAIDSIATDDLTNTTINDTPPFKRHHATSDPNSLRSSGTSGVSSGGAEEPEGTHLERLGTFTRHTSTVRRKKLLSVDLPPSPVVGDSPDASFDSTNAMENSYTKYSARNGVRRAQSMALRPTGNVATVSIAAEGRRLTWRERRALNLQKSSAVDLPFPPPMNSSSPLAKRDRKDWSHLQAGNVGIHRTMSDKRTFGPTRLQDRWKYPVECLELTVEELVHIRQVLTRADLEKYQGQGQLYTSLKTGKVCFNCRIREFNIFWWARTCQICHQKVCSKCMRKVRAPTDAYLKTPVHSLSPSLNPSSSVDHPPYGVENANHPHARLAFDSKLTVLRERNIQEAPVQAPPKFQLPSTSWRSKGGRKMDVCEECCDLISRIIQTNSVAENGNMYKTAWSQKESFDLAKYVFARPTSVSDRLLRRSTSSAGFMGPYIRRGNIGSSKSIHSFQAAAK